MSDFCDFLLLLLSGFVGCSQFISLLCTVYCIASPSFTWRLLTDICALYSFFILFLFFFTSMTNAGVSILSWLLEYKYRVYLGFVLRGGISGAWHTCLFNFTRSCQTVKGVVPIYSILCKVGEFSLLHICFIVTFYWLCNLHFVCIYIEIFLYVCIIYTTCVYVYTVYMYILCTYIDTYIKTMCLYIIHLYLHSNTQSCILQILYNILYRKFKDFARAVVSISNSLSLL